MRFLSASGSVACGLCAVFFLYGVCQPMRGPNGLEVALTALVLAVLSGAGCVLLMRRAMR